MEAKMSQRGIDFANEWISENINAGPYAPEDSPHPEADAAVKQLLADAAEAGITREEIEDDIGDLGDFISGAYEDSTDAEVQRLVDKDPY